MNNLIFTPWDMLAFSAVILMLMKENLYLLKRLKVALDALKECSELLRELYEK